jgi:hypothetical protein
MGALHDRDFYAWTQEQVRLLRRARDSGSNLALDWDGLIEEIEGLGASEANELTSNLARILEHLAKLAWSPTSDPRRVWTLSVKEHRARVGIRLRRSPSLKRRLPDLLVDAWEIALPRIARSLPSLPDGSPLPETCPFTIDQALDPDWYPPAPGPKA